MKKIIFIFLTVLLMSGCSSGDSDEITILDENYKILQDNIVEKCGEPGTIYLNDIATFEWDRVLFFSPYASVESMQNKIGYNFSELKVTEVDSIIQIVFMKSEEVICYIYENLNDENIQFALFSEKEELFSEDNPKFIVSDASSSLIDFPILSYRE